MAQIQINPDQFESIRKHVRVKTGEELALDQIWDSGKSHLRGLISQGHDIIDSFDIAPDGEVVWAERNNT